MPVFFGPCSNGEYDPEPLGPVVQEAQRRARAEADAAARRLGMSRRRFLRSVCGSALTLLALDACSRDSGGGKGGRYSLPPSSTTEPDAARETLAGEQFVFDVQSHLLEGDDGFGSGFPQAACGDGNCFSIDHYLDAVFVRSDTSMAVLSAIPATGYDGPLSIEVMEATRKVAAAAHCDDRLLLHGQAIPTRPDSGDHMRRVAAEHPIAAWKAYTHTPTKWRLDDQVGERFIATAVELGIPRICVHKGFGADPADVGPAAKAHPNVAFVAYHSGYEPGQPAAVDRLLSSMRQAGIGPNANVYAELGSTWFNLMKSPDDAAHVLGKLLRDVGEDNVLWGTDSIWYGSPQGQLEAFRAFEITPEFQERFGYPALTPAVKAKVLGANAARFYGIKPTPRPRCTTDRAELERLREEQPDVGALGPRTPAAAAAVRARDWAWSAA